MENRLKKVITNAVLIIMLILCLAIGAFVILLSTSKTEVAEKGTEAIEKSYTTTEGTSTTNTWDISKNGDGSIIATLANDGTLTISGIGEMKDWSIGDTTDWHANKNNVKSVIIEDGITNIGERAFDYCTNLESIEILEGVTSIGSDALSHCKSLTSIEIPRSVTSIGYRAFFNCTSLSSIEIPEGVTYIGNEAFWECKSLTSIKVEENNTSYKDDNGVLYSKDGTKMIQYPAKKDGTTYTILRGTKSIEEYTFKYCENLINIEIPSSVTSIGRNAFYGCTSLASIEVEENNTSYKDDNAALYSKDGTKIIKYPPRKEGVNYSIAEGVTNIENEAFYKCENLLSIEIPNSVTSIGDRAFGWCTSLTSIGFSEGLISIGVDSFLHCESLATIKIPSSVTSIGNCAFSDCKSLTSIEIPSSVTSIGNCAFSNCTSLATIKIPSSVTSIGDSAFSNCTSLTIIEIPESVTSIGDKILYGAKLSRLIQTTDENNELPNILRRAQNEKDILYSSNDFELTNCTIEDSKIIIIDKQSHATIKVTSGKLKGLTYILKYNIKDISANGDGSVIATLAGDGTLTISGTGDMKDWNNNSDTDWREMGNNVKSVIIDEGVTSIGKKAFYNWTSLSSIKIPNSVTSIGYNAFESCTSLPSIEIPEGVTSIGYRAFYWCTSLTSIKIPNTVTSIGERAFDSCYGLTNIEINEGNTNYKDVNGVLYSKDGKKIIRYPQGKKESNYSIVEGVTNIGDYAFDECKSLTSIEIPEGVTSIGHCAFFSCTNLPSIEIPSSVTSIESRAFYWCTSLTSIEIPRSVTSIEEAAFFECTRLVSIDVDENNTSYKDINGVLYSKDGTEIIKYPQGKEESNYSIAEGVTIIGRYAFSSCNNLVSIEIPRSVTSIEMYAFSYGTSLENIKIPNSVTSIDDYAFHDCYSTIICKSGTMAETYAKEHEKNYIIDDAAPIINSNPELQTNPIQKIEVEVNVTDECAGVDEESIKYLWTTESKNVTKEQINNTFINGETIEIKDVTGKYYLWIYAIDQVGNETIVKKGEFNLDNIKPEINVSQSTSNPTQKVEVKVNVTDENAGVDEENIKYLWSTESESITKEQINNTLVNGETLEIKDVTGKYYLWIYARDLAGNEIIVKTGEYYLDNIKPEINVSQSTTNQTQKVEVRVDVTDNVGVDEENIKYLWTTESQNITKEQINNNLINGETLELKDVTGNYYLWIYARDLAGNEIIVKKGVYILDNTKPEININYSTINPTNQNVTVKITTNETVQIVEGWEISTDGKELTKKYTRNTEKQGEIIEIKDIAGNKNTANIKILNIDKINPELTLTTKATENTIEVEAIASDSGSGIDETTYKYSIKEQNGNYGTQIVDGEKHIFKNLVRNQKYIIKVEVSDRAGNTTTKEIEATPKTNKITSIKYTVQEENLIIRGIQPNTTVEKLKSNLQSDYDYRIINSKGENVLSKSLVGTGYKIKIQEKIYTIIVLGDTNGDGKSNIQDILKINKHRLNIASLTAEYLQAGDVDGDGNSNIRDILKINKFRLGIINQL